MKYYAIQFHILNKENVDCFQLFIYMFLYYLC